MLSPFLSLSLSYVCVLCVFVYVCPHLGGGQGITNLQGSFLPYHVRSGDQTQREKPVWDCRVESCIGLLLLGEEQGLPVTYYPPIPSSFNKVRWPPLWYWNIAGIQVDVNPASQGTVFQLETERPVTRDVLIKVLPGGSKVARERGEPSQGCREYNVTGIEELLSPGWAQWWGGIWGDAWGQGGQLSWIRRVSDYRGLWPQRQQQVKTLRSGHFGTAKE